VLIPDYLVEHDLPSAYQRATGLTTGSSSAERLATPLPASAGRVIELRVGDLRRADGDESHGRVRLLAAQAPADDAFAVRVPNPGLGSVGFHAGGWLVVRPVSPVDLGVESWLVVLRGRGSFGATGSNWTIAHVKELPGDEGTPSRIQLSYGSATGKEYRPERLDRADVRLAATIVCHAEEAS
jgi:hypothetical protein